MAHFNFVIPGNKAELLTESDDYSVRDTIGPKDIQNKLKDARGQFRDEGAEYIIETFDTYYSVLHHGDTLPLDVIFKTYEDLHRATNELNKALGFILEDKDSLNDEIKVKFLNMLKMMLYVYTQVILLLESKLQAKSANILKGRKKPKETDDYYVDKKAVMITLNNIVQRDISMFWDPPVVEENFVNIVSEVCYRFLQNPSVKNDKEVRLEIFNLIGSLIKGYNHGTTFVIRMVQLIKMHEHIVDCLPEGAQQLVLTFNCKGLIHDLVREVTEWQTDEKYQDSQGARFCAQILSKMAELMPDLMIPELMYLNRYLGHESATLRNSVLNVIAEVVLKVLTNHDLTEEQRESRDDFITILLEHTHDTASHVRSKVISHFARLQKENAIPLKFQAQILERVIEHLCDKGALVRKSAIACVTTFLSHNTFSSNLSLKSMEEELKKKQDMLNVIKSQFEGIKMKKLEEIEEEWKKRQDDLQKVVEEELEKEKSDENEKGDESSEIPKEQIPDLVRMYLNENKYADAFKLCKMAGEEIEEWQQFRENNEDDGVDMYMLIMKSIFINAGKLIEEIKAHIIQSGVKMTEEDFKKMEALEAACLFLQDSVQFLKFIDAAIPTLIELLETTAMHDMHEAVSFFITAYQFNIDNAESGILGMLKIMQRSEQERKDYIINAFKTIYLSTDTKNMDEHTTTIVKRLISLIKSVPVNNFDDLQQIISEWTSKGVLDNSVIDMLWKYFTKNTKTPVSDEDSRAAAELLRMASLGRKTIISRNIKLVATIAFKERGESSMLFLGSCCDLLAVAGRIKIDVTQKNPPFKIKYNDEIFADLSNILVDKFLEPVEYYYKALSGGIEFIYRLCSKPEKTCEDLITRIVEKFIKEISEQEKEVETFIIVRLCQLLGFVAVRHLEYLDDTVYKELKRRNNIRAERKDKKSEKKESKKAKRNKNNSTINNTTSTDNTTAINSTMDESTLEGAQAEDTDAEFILNVLENDTVLGSGGLGKLAYIIKGICQRPDVYDDVMIQGSAVIALIRFMLVSSRFCQENIQLLFTIFEKTDYPEVKCTILVHLSDLLTRFPNIIEPWTPRIYQRLKDPQDSIRKATFFTLSNLILRDMIRAHSHISEMVCCLVDEDQELSSMCKTFFLNLSHKENNLYNVLPDIFSHLMDLEDMTEENIHGIMKFLFELMDKSKHMENLVDRFCTKFRLSEDIKHHRHIAHCLNLITYNEKALSKLQENFLTYKHLVHDAEIYTYFKNILQSCNKPQVGKGDLKSIAAEIEQSINSVFELNEDGQLMKPPPVPKMTKGKSKKSGNKRKASKKASSDEDSGEEPEKEKNTPQRKNKGRRARKRINPINDDSD